MPELEKIALEQKDSGVRFLALSLEPDEELVMRALAKWGISTLPVAIAESETLGPLAVNQVPATLFIGSDGIIVAAANGERGRGFFQRRIKDLLEREKKLE